MDGLIERGAAGAATPIHFQHQPSLRGWAEEIPPIAFKVKEDGDLSVRLDARRAHEPNPSGGQSCVAACKVFHAKKEADSTRELLSDDERLAIPFGTRE